MLSFVIQSAVAVKFADAVEPIVVFAVENLIFLINYFFEKIWGDKCESLADKITFLVNSE